MKLFTSTVLGMTVAKASQLEIAKCGVDMTPGEKQECLDKFRDAGLEWTQPQCEADEACYRTDACSFSCIKKLECLDNGNKPYDSVTDDNKHICNCLNKPPLYDMTWSCLPTTFEKGVHQDSFAIVPAIRREDENDTRRITILPGSMNDKFNAITSTFGTDGEQVMSLFSSSKCTGQSVVLEDGR